MTTMEDIARAAGVSLTTVSHVFSGKRPVAPDTRKRVQAVARRLRYQPHRMARGLATGRTMTIAIHFPFQGDSFVLDPYFPKLFEGMSGVAADSGYGFILLPASARENGFPIARLLRERRFDGAIVVDPLIDNSLIPLFRSHSVPIVTTGRLAGSDDIPWVDHDNRGGMRRLIRHLHQMGYQRPALISMEGGLSYARDIEESFSETTEGTIVRAAAISEEQGYKVAVRLLGRRLPPDAIVTAGDRQAIGVLRAARERGIEVPRDLGVAGAGNSVLASHSHPPLTSVRVSVRELGELAVHRLISILDEAHPPPTEMSLPTKLIIRLSTRRAEGGPPAA